MRLRARVTHPNHQPHLTHPNHQPHLTHSSKSIADWMTPPETMGPSRIKRVRQPDPCRFGWIYPQLLLVIAICVTYQVLCKIINNIYKTYKRYFKT